MVTECGGSNPEQITFIDHVDANGNIMQMENNLFHWIYIKIISKKSCLSDIKNEAIFDFDAKSFALRNYHNSLFIHWPIFGTVYNLLTFLKFSADCLT